MTLDISGDLLCLFSSRVERRDGTYVIEIPESEVVDGDVDEDGVYRIGVLSAGRGEDTGGRAAGGESRGRGSRDLQPPVEEGEIRYVEIEDIGKQGDGIARVERGYVIIVPGADMGDRVKVEVDEVKENFAVGEVLEENAFE